MLWYLLSKPDDWQVMVPDLMQNCGRDKVKNILGELISHGYLEKSEKQPHGDAGHFARPEYRVHEEPLTEKPSTVEPSTAKPPLHNTEEEHKRENITTSSDRPNIFTVYEQNCGVLTPFIAAELNYWIDLVQESWIEDAIKIAVMNNKRNMNYVAAILKRWQNEGKDDGFGNKHNEKQPQPHPWA